MTLKGNSLRVVPSEQNIPTLFLEFQLESLSFEAIIRFSSSKVTKRRYIIATVLQKRWYMCTLLTA